MCQLLCTRQLTGNDARAAIELALATSTQHEWNFWYRRILIKDLRCGISEKTVNKILKNTSIELIPVFDVMLAHDGANHIRKIAGKKLLEPKYDGVRCITVINYESKTVEQFSRNGKLLENFPHITNGLLANIEDFGRSYVIDGEVISSSFQALMTQVRRKDNVKADDAILMAFDIMPLSEFRKGKSVMGQRRRSKFLQSLKPIFSKCNGIRVTEQEEVDLDTFVGQIQFKDFNRKQLDAGLEGIMIKEVNDVYECKRSTSWLKQKPFIEVSLTIVGVEEGTGKNAGKLGAFVCEGTDDNKKIKVNVGSGITDDDREIIWAEKESVIGQVAEIRADAITRNQDSENTYSLRFPRFLRYRGFIAGQKI